MCGSIGSTSAQTPSESSQESNSGGAAADANAVAGVILGWAPGQYQAVHVWKPTVPGSPVHHSHIQIKTMAGADLFHFGLFGDEHGAAFIVGGPGAAPSRSGYTVSTSYRPNPATVTRDQMLAAYNAALAACGGRYKLLANNCQKFGRMFMTGLGSSHHRKLFHP